MSNYNLIKVDVSTQENIDNFIKFIKSTFPFHELFNSKLPLYIKTHYHPDFESRLFIEGEAEFNIDGEIVKCSPGSYLEIFPDVPHSFSFDGNNLKVLRFSSEYENWQAIFE
jgi:cupin superfamily acireductone dioxygenase involved in methionine salvage